MTETAWEMLVSHARFLANVSVRAADRLIEAFIEGTDGLAEMPERYPWLYHDDIPFQKYRKLMFGKYHLALYEILGNIVYVTAVVDCRQDYAWLLSHT
ncbi:MAG: type II toxin-antitoxin system RelE/ParE family toxin [Clostridiales Family XIII bacterium]|nr:type II toxin-antitoxin system RelE/ParE family toxin [Clostridiales Family XIII bacterium]